MKPFQKILVPVDFSAHSNQVLQVAAQICLHYRAAATLLHVWEPELFSIPESYRLYDPEAVPRWPDQFMLLLGDARQVMKTAGAPEVEVALTQGRPSAAIERFARDGAFDLIVMGTHGRTALSHVLMGSVTEDVMRRAPCALMAVRLTGGHGEEPPGHRVSKPAVSS